MGRWQIRKNTYCAPSVCVLFLDGFFLAVGQRARICSTLKVKTNFRVNVRERKKKKSCKLRWMGKILYEYPRKWEIRKKKIFHWVRKIATKWNLRFGGRCKQRRRGKNWVPTKKHLLYKKIIGPHSGWFNLFSMLSVSILRSFEWI